MLRAARVKGEREEEERRCRTRQAGAAAVGEAEHPVGHSEPIWALNKQAKKNLPWCFFAVFWVMNTKNKHERPSPGSQAASQLHFKST